MHMSALHLLSADDKRQFFGKLEDLLKTKRPKRPHADAAKCRSITCEKPASSTGTRRQAATGKDQPPPETTQHKEEKMRDFKHLAAMQGKRAASKKSGGPATKRSKQSATSAVETKGLLHGQRVLFVPIGRDVSRKRLEIWSDMVVKLGGSVVQINAKAKSGEPVTDWKAVDLIIASAELAATKAMEYLRIDKFPPAGIAVNTPEWLVYMLKEKKKPSVEVELSWSGQQEVREEEEKEAQRREEIAKHIAEQHGGNDEESSGSESDEGSNSRSSGTRAILRASPARDDSEQFRQQQGQLNAKRAKLVAERTPIFFENNPGFKPISESAAPGSKRVKGDGFICQRSSAVLRNFNAHLTDPLEEIMEFFTVEKDIWREYMYKKLVSSLKAMRCRVSSVKDLKDLHWAKGRLKDKVVEILETGRLSKLEAKKKNARLCALVEIARIWGVGPATAAKLYSMGFKTLDNLTTPEAAAVLTAQQQIGLKHYQDFLTKIPRDEVSQIEKTVVDEVHKMIPNAHALACGSYRRGKPACGDCDVLITDPDNDVCDILSKLLERLHATGFLTDDLTHFSKQNVGGCDTYMGVCRVSKDLPHRRLDIKVYPRQFFGFAILYFTGSDHFNRSMRCFANKNGWSLSDRALTRVMRVNGLKVKQGESVICESEVDVFIALGLEYKDPTERNCFDIKFLDEDEAKAKRGAKSPVEAGNSE